MNNIEIEEFKESMDKAGLKDSFLLKCTYDLLDNENTSDYVKYNLLQMCFKLKGKVETGLPDLAKPKELTTDDYVKMIDEKAKFYNVDKLLTQRLKQTSKKLKNESKSKKKR